MDYAYIAKASAAVRAELRGQTANAELVAKVLVQCAITEAVCDEATDLLAVCEEAKFYVALGCASTVKTTKAGQERAGELLLKLEAVIAKVRGQ